MATDQPRGWLARLSTPVDIASLVVFRIGFGAIMLWEVVRYTIPRSDGMSWIEGVFVNPRYHFTYPGFDWVQPWPGPGMTIHFVFLGLLAVCVMLGLGYRLSAFLFFLGYSYVFLLDKTQYRNHFYLICLLSFLMSIVPAHRAFSLDARLRPAIRTATVPVWTLGLLLAQLSIVYFFAGVAKLDGDWLSGAPIRVMLANREDFPLLGPFVDQTWLAVFFTYGGLVFDLVVAPLLLWSKTRVWAYLAALFFHLTNSQVFEIGIFPWLMILATTLYFPPSWPRRLVAWWRPGTRAPRIRAHAPSASRWRIAGFGFLALYLAVQVLVPLRHLAYPGPAIWTEEGHRFAWRMMLKAKVPEPRYTWIRITDKATGRAWLVSAHDHLPPEKARGIIRDRAALRDLCQSLARAWHRKGHPEVAMEPLAWHVDIVVTDPSTNERWRVPPQTYLIHAQSYDMATKPDMALQFAHFLGDELARDRGTPVEVRLESWVTVNGRPYQQFIDPSVDLTTWPRSRRPRTWIRPLETPAPGLGDDIFVAR